MNENQPAMLRRWIGVGARLAAAVFLVAVGDPLWAAFYLFLAGSMFNE